MKLSLLLAFQRKGKRKALPKWTWVPYLEIQVAVFQVGQGRGDRVEVCANAQRTIRVAYGGMQAV